MNYSVLSSSSKSIAIYHGLDVTKLICALLIVYLHAYIDDLGPISTWFRNVISYSGVPFFFITSGFLFRKGLIRNNYSKNYFKKYVIKLIKMYIAWTIITLPVSWLCIEWGHPEYSVPLKVIYLFRMILFSGSCGIYWYLLALFESAIIIYYCHLKNKEWILFLFSIILFLLGVIYNSPYNNNNALFRLIHIIFGSSRNFLNEGLFYMCIGYLLAKESYSIKRNHLFYIVSLTLAFIARTLEWRIGIYGFFIASIAVILFIWGKNTDININYKISITFRKLSTAIYLLHFPFLLVFDYNFKRGTLTGFFLALLFSIFVFFFLKRILPDKTMKLLFG